MNIPPEVLLASTVVVLAFFTTVIAIVAIVFGRWEVVNTAISTLRESLHQVLMAFTRQK